MIINCHHTQKDFFIDEIKKLANNRFAKTFHHHFENYLFIVETNRNTRIFNMRDLNDKDIQTFISEAHQILKKKLNEQLQMF